MGSQWQPESSGPEYAFVKIESNGTAAGTSVKVGDKYIDGLVAATWTVRVDEFASVILEFELPEAHITAREIILQSGETEESA